ncbi:MAG: hypothetical protein RSE54_09860, partial [Ruthenibacterium sp.]
VALFPEIEGGKGKGTTTIGAQNSGIAVNVNLDGAKKEAAFTFLQYFFAEDMYTKLVDAGFLVPATVTTDTVTPGLQALIDLNSVKMSSVYDTILPASVVTVLQNGLQALTMGDTAPDALAQELQTAMDAELAS